MKTIKLLLVSLFIISASISSARDNGKNYGECSCVCEYCKEWENNHYEEWGEYNYRIMSERDFSDLKKLISERSFESTKVELAKSGIERNYFRTEQVRELLMLFTFETNKLDLAKVAYSRTQDRNRYYKLYDVFTFESSITDMEDFIKNRKN